jgi:hypothetical protein
LDRDPFRPAEGEFRSFSFLARALFEQLRASLTRMERTLEGWIRKSWRALWCAMMGSASPAHALCRPPQYLSHSRLRGTPRNPRRASDQLPEKGACNKALAAFPLTSNPFSVCALFPYWPEGMINEYEAILIKHSSPSFPSFLLLT